MRLFRKKPGFIIFGLGRSGSNLLRSLINSHSEIYCDIEIFNIKSHKDKPKWKVKILYNFPLWYIKRKNNIFKNKIYGFKLFVWQHNNVVHIIKKLHNLEWKIIYLKRLNTLRQTFSQLIGQETQRWVNTDPHFSDSDHYYLDPGQVLNTLQNIEQNKNFAEYLLQNIDHLEINYENDLSDKAMWKKTGAQVFQFLNLEPVEVKSFHLMTDTRKDKDRILNFDEIIDFLNRNGYENEVQTYFKYLIEN